MTDRSDMVLRHADFTLTDEQAALEATFQALFERQCPREVVRAAEPLGFDEKLWDQLTQTRAIAMGVPAHRGGDGAGLSELVLVAELQGLSLAPVPFVEAVVTARLLARLANPVASSWLDELLGGGRIATFAVSTGPEGREQLVPAGAVANAVVGLDGDELVLRTQAEAPRLVDNTGSAPLAWWSLHDADSRTVLATGREAQSLFSGARREWRLLTAAALVGIAEGALRLGTGHAKERRAFGVPIGSFQAVSHRLVDVYIGVTGLRRLTRKASWYADHEPELGPKLASMAFAEATRTAMDACIAAVHVLGGVGFTVDSDAQLYFRRVKGWALVAGDPAAELQEIADLVFGPARATHAGLS